MEFRGPPSFSGSLGLGPTKTEYRAGPYLEYGYVSAVSSRPENERIANTMKRKAANHQPPAKFPVRVLIVAALFVVAVSIFLLTVSSRTPESGPPITAQSSPATANANQATAAPGALTLIEFGDYQCPSCGAYYPVVKQLVSDFEGQMNLVFRNYPLGQHRNAYAAAQAAEAAGLQGKFWEMHDILYENQPTWAESSTARDIFVQYAQKLGLDINRFKTDAASTAVKSKIDGDIQAGDQLAVGGTPTFFLNGQKIANPPSYEAFSALIKAALAKAPVAQAPAELYHIHANFKVYVDGKPVDFSLAKYQSTTANPLNPFVHLHDGNGDIIHVHKQGVTLGDFFKSLGMSLTSTCFSPSIGQQYCANGDATLSMFVNGKPNTQFDAYVPQDLDRILLSFGSESAQQLEGQMNSVADTACIYSLKCPERGKPPTETCVGGLGTACTD
jgi:protein-disulfide isomerase